MKKRYIDKNNVSDVKSRKKNPLNHQLDTGKTTV